MTDVDVLIVGAGPAGAAAATFLARSGHAVVVVDEDTFPRFHIGESLLPAVLPVTDELGIDLGDGQHQYKSGARFLDEVTGQTQTYPFADALEGPPRFAYHVERSVFDLQVARAAESAGAQIRFGARVEEIEFLEDAVEVQTSEESYRARYVVDASGRSAWLGRRFKSLRRLQHFGRAASFVHYEGLSDAAWDEILPDANIEVIRVPSGWVWAIPLVGQRLSVGVVSREGKMRPEDIFSVVADSPLLSRWTSGAQHTEPSLIGDYSFRNERPHGSRFACIGDSACFLDPVFSSGVALGLLAARSAAPKISAGLRGGTEADPGLLVEHQAHMLAGYQAFYSLIHRFYNTAILDNLFFAEEPDPIFRAGLITMLAGDTWRDDNAFQNMLSKSMRHAAEEGFVVAAGSSATGASPNAST